jgi:hypothetical protein
MRLRNWNENKENTDSRFLSINKNKIYFDLDLAIYNFYLYKELD